MSDDLVTWLRAQLDEDETVARFALPAMGEKWTPMYGEAAVIRVSVDDHANRHSPARVLREVEAKRRIIDLYETLNQPALYEAIQALALPYADRDGYREEWRP